MLHLQGVLRHRVRWESVPHSWLLLFHPSTNRFGSPKKVSVASAVIGPTPGCVISRRAWGRCQANSPAFRSKSSICCSRCRYSDCRAVRR
jgi:hypothetical protein